MPNSPSTKVNERKRMPDFWSNSKWLRRGEMSSLQYVLVLRDRECTKFTAGFYCVAEKYKLMKLCQETTNKQREKTVLRNCKYYAIAFRHRNRSWMNCLRIERKRLDVEYRRQYFRSIWNSNHFVKIFFCQIKLFSGFGRCKSSGQKLHKTRNSVCKRFLRNSSRLSKQQAFMHRTICKKDFMTMSIKDLLKGQQSAPVNCKWLLRMSFIVSVVNVTQQFSQSFEFCNIFGLPRLCLSLLCNPFRKRDPKTLPLKIVSKSVWCIVSISRELNKILFYPLQSPSGADFWLFYA